MRSFEVLDVRRIGMMVGEVAVDLAEELLHRAAEPAVELGRGRAGDAVAAVDDDAAAGA